MHISSLYLIHLIAEVVINDRLLFFSHSSENLQNHIKHDYASNQEWKRAYLFIFKDFEVISYDIRIQYVGDQVENSHDYVPG